MSFSIAGTGSALPGETVSNERLGEFLQTSDEWIRTRTGIKNRHVLTSESLKDLAMEAAKNALRMSGTVALDLDLIICSTVSPDHVIPTLACEVQLALGANCPAFDLNAACSGFIYALDIAAGYFARKKDSRVLVIAADAMSRIVDWRDRATCVLFGDGAGAALLKEGDDLRAITIGAQGSETIIALPGPKGNSPFAPQTESHPFVTMEGKEVYRFAVSSSVRDLLKVLDMANLRQEDIDLVLLHQANARILEAVSARMNIPGDKFPSNIAECGNISSASIPILLDELNRKGALRPGQTLAMSTFGGGLTTGACIIQWHGTGPEAL
jgi:3-oxoacyl-[acyl-carrier-protein] synthase-3